MDNKTIGIVILVLFAIFMIIGLPLIMNKTNNAKDNAFFTSKDLSKHGDLGLK